MELENYEEGIRYERKWKRIYLAALLIIGIVAVGQITYDWYQANNLTATYNILVSRYNSLSAGYSSLMNKASYLNGSLNELQREMENMLQAYDQTRVVYQTPGVNTSIPIWTRQAVVQPGAPRNWEAWNLLDTFVNHIRITSNATARYVIVDLPNFVRLVQNETFVSEVDYSGTNFTFAERLSQGCAVYVLVILDYSSHPILLTPDVTANYAPTPFLTGECSLTP